MALIKHLILKFTSLSGSGYILSGLSLPFQFYRPSLQVDILHLLLPKHHTGGHQYPASTS